MPRHCTICDHPDRDAIDKALVAGESFRNISERFETSTTALFRHKSSHIPEELSRATQATEVARADNLLDQVRDLQGKALGILAQAEATGDLRTALIAIREARGVVELLAKLVGELDQRPVTNVLVAPEWLSLRSTILAALKPYPQACRAVADALAEASNL